jgi:hypothetical protein
MREPTVGIYVLLCVTVLLLVGMCNEGPPKPERRRPEAARHG